MRHKKITIPFFVIWILHIATLTFAQTHTVVKTRGKVALQTNNKPLRRDDKFKMGPLRFSNIKDALVTIDEKEGAFLHIPADSTLTKHRSKPLRGPVGTRPGHILTDFQLRSFLNQNNTLLLLDGQFSLVLGKEAFPIDNQHYFYLQYTWHGEQIPKMLHFRGDTLLIDAKELYKVDEKPINPSEVSEEYYLFYYSEKDSISNAYPALDVPLYLARPDTDVLKQEIALLLKGNASQARQERLRQIEAYLEAVYGKPGDAELDRFLKGY